MTSPVSTPVASAPGPLRTPLLARREVAPRHYQITLQQPSVAATARPGQFVHILCRDGRATDPLLRRAFSVMRVAGDTYDILFRVEGKGTAWLSEIALGTELDILGPLGNGFDQTAWPSHEIIVVGGGVGVPPLVFLANQYQHTQSAGLSAFVGARSSADLIGIPELTAAQASIHISTEDGSAGHHGRITEPLRDYLDNLTSERPRTVYACGPLPMLQAVALLCLSREVPCQVSLEENMPCGVGLCSGCVVGTLDHGQSGRTDFERYSRICVDGPALWAHDIDWGQA